MMHENVLTAVLLDKTKPFFIIKPFYFSFWHFLVLFITFID